MMADTQQHAPLYLTHATKGHRHRRSLAIAGDFDFLPNHHANIYTRRKSIESKTRYKSGIPEPIINLDDILTTQSENIDHKRSDSAPAELDFVMLKSVLRFDEGISDSDSTKIPEEEEEDEEDEKCENFKSSDSEFLSGLAPAVESANITLPSKNDISKLNVLKINKQKERYSNYSKQWFQNLPAPNTESSGKASPLALSVSSSPRINHLRRKSVTYHSGRRRSFKYNDKTPSFVKSRSMNSFDFKSQVYDVLDNEVTHISSNEEQKTRVNDIDGLVTSIERSLPVIQVTMSKTETGSFSMASDKLHINDARIIKRQPFKFKCLLKKVIKKLDDLL